MNRACALAAVLFGIGALLPTQAPAQNLEAGKSPGQLFTNTCTACHRSPRGLLRTVPPGSLPGFLREHYTTSRDMAQQLAGFLIANGATDTRGRPPEVRQQPAGAEPPRQRPGEPDQQQPRPRRPIEQEQVARPPEPQQAAPPALNDARLSRRERRAKREAERRRDAQPPPAATSPIAERDPDSRQKNRRSRITPARIEAASERGKDALPLGSVVKSEPAAETVKPETRPEAVAPQPEPVEAVKPVTATGPPEPATRPDPVPQVTPAPPSGSTTEAPREKSAPEAQRGDDPPSGSTPPAAPPEPPALAPAAPASAPPAPPISN